MKKIIFFFLIITSTHLANAQEKLELSGNSEISSFLFSNKLPFWLHANSGSFRNNETNLAATFNVFAEYDIAASHKLQLGVGFFYRDGVTVQDFQRNNLYIKYKNAIITATLGSEEVQDKFQGLGVVRDNFSLSGNTRALPGLNIELTEPIKITNKLSVDASIAHYSLNDERVVKDAYVHNKSLEILWNFNANNKLTLGIEHFVQWGGTSSINGDQPDDFNAFIDVFFASAGNEEATNNDQLNALGNSLGYYNFQYDIASTSGNYRLYHHHPFEDGSGTRLRNFPDGIWGFYYSLNESNYDSILRGFLLEYVSTVSQSGSTGRSGRDSYFNNRIYQSGWTYEGNVLGLPFITVPNNTRIEAFHLGINLEIEKWSLLFKGSFVRSLGTFFVPITPINNNLIFYAENSYRLDEVSSVQLITGLDINSGNSNNLGIGISYQRKF